MHIIILHEFLLPCFDRWLNWGSEMLELPRNQWASAWQGWNPKAVLSLSTPEQSTSLSNTARTANFQRIGTAPGWWLSVPGTHYRRRGRILTGTLPWESSWGLNRALASSTLPSIATDNVLSGSKKKLCMTCAEGRSSATQDQLWDCISSAFVTAPYWLGVGGQKPLL